MIISVGVDGERHRFSQKSRWKREDDVTESLNGSLDPRELKILTHTSLMHMKTAFYFPNDAKA